MADFLNQYMHTIATLVSLAILVTIYFAFKYQINLWWLSFWYSMPVIGKMARISKDTTRYAKDKAWTNAERTLCDDYNQFMKYISPTELHKRLVYLAKAHDLGRTPLPAWLVFVLGLLVIAEGLGFSYLLGTWMAMEGSENTRILLMFAIVLVLCVILLFVTHSAGHQLYRTNLVKRCEKEWTDAGQPGNLRSANVMLNGDQSIDDNQPEFTQCVNRVGTSGSYVMVIVAVVVIAVIAGMSTWMRVKHLENDQIQETTQAGAMQATPSANAGNPFAGGSLPLPQDVLKPQAEADQKAKQDSGKAFHDEGLAAFLMLAFIFVVTQIVGIAAGYKWGFAGKESKAAYAGTHGFSTYDDYQAYYAPVIRIAQAKLQSLQQRLRGANVSLDLKKSFEDYLDELRQPRTGNTAAAPSPAQPVAATSNLGSPTTVEQALASIEAMGDDKEAAKKYVLALDASLKDPVMQALKERKMRKEEEQRKAAQDQQSRELDELL